MRYTITQVTIIDIDSEGKSQVISTRTDISPVSAEAPVDITASVSIRQPNKVVSHVRITRSQLLYGYLTLGRRNRIQMPVGERITVVRGDRAVTHQTHASQPNRVDAMKPILSGLHEDDEVKCVWDPDARTLEIL